MHFYACILDSLMLQDAHVIMERDDSAHSEEYKKYRNTYVLHVLLSLTFRGHQV